MPRYQFAREVRPGPMKREKMRVDRRRFLGIVGLIVGSPCFGQSSNEAFEAYEASTGGRIGVYAANLATGAVISWRSEDRVVMCSTFKASLAGLVLKRRDQRQVRLSDPIRLRPADLEEYAPVARANVQKGSMTVGEMCAAAVEYSDNTCANLLLARFGGPEALTEFWRSLGDTISRLDHNEPLLNRTPLGGLEDTTTPAAMAENLRKLLLEDSLSARSRRQLTEWMVACKTGADRLRAGLPESWRIADKTGNNGKDAFGDLAMAWNGRREPIVIAGYTRGGSPTAKQVEMVFKQIGLKVADAFS